MRKTKPSMQRERLEGRWEVEDETVAGIQSEGSRSRAGLIIVVDEMGKFLEHAASERSDIYLFQQLAELASRSEGRLILIGVLHQAFEEYAHRLGREQRDEWAKVQGRFIDLLVNTASEEQLELLSASHPVRSQVPRGLPNSLACGRVHLRQPARQPNQPERNIRALLAPTSGYSSIARANF